MRLKLPLVLRSRCEAKIAKLELRLAKCRARAEKIEAKLALARDKEQGRKWELDEAWRQIHHLHGICETRARQLEQLHEELVDTRRSRARLLDRLAAARQTAVGRPERRGIPVVLGVDVEPDGRALDRENPAWEGTVRFFQELPGFRGMLQEVAGADSVPLTWFPRADPQVEMANGDAAWALREFAGDWRAALEAGDEIGLHMHPWRWNEPGQEWVQDLGDEAWLIHCLHLAVKTYEDHFKTLPPSYRGGDRFLSPAVVRELQALGVKVDLTLERMPRVERLVQSEKGTGEIPDGTMVPRQGYRPHPEDFRVPDPGARSGLGMLPLTPCEKGTLTLWLPNTVFEEELDQLMDDGEPLTHLAFVVRSSVAVSSYHWGNVLENARSLARRAGQGQLQFMTAGQAWERVAEIAGAISPAR